MLDIDTAVDVVREDETTRVVIVRDPDAENPRGFETASMIVTIDGDSRGVWDLAEDNLAGAPAHTVQGGIRRFGFVTVARWLRVFHGAVTIVPLYRSNNGRSPGEPQNKPNAGDYIGVAYTTDLHTFVETVFAEVIEYEEWANGECYGWQKYERDPIDEEWEQTDACYGYYGYDDASDAGRSA